MFRAGGYWWDGSTWYRPAQTFNWTTEAFIQTPVPTASTTTAADLLLTGGDERRGQTLTVADIDPDRLPAGQWLDSLALWATTSNPSRAVVALAAPELAVDSLLPAAVVADIAGISPSTLRAYVARGEAEFPVPQASGRGRNLWARPVAESGRRTDATPRRPTG